MKHIEFMEQTKFLHKYPQRKAIIHYSSEQTEFGLALCALVEKKICAFGFGFDRDDRPLTEDELLARMRDKYSVFTKGRQLKKLAEPYPINDALQEFFKSKGEITPSILAVGTTNQIAGWQEMCRVPYGSNHCTYENLAKNLNSHARQVGTNVVAANPIALFLPCHRIVAKANKQNYAYGVFCKEALQMKEIDTLKK